MKRLWLLQFTHGEVRIELPKDMSQDEVDDLDELFGLIIKQVRRTETDKKEPGR